jgi:hypothetical protein
VTDELDRLARQWLHADRTDQEQAADERFRHLLTAVPHLEPPAEFGERVVKAVWRARMRRRATTAIVRVAGVAAVLMASAVLIYIAIVGLGALAVRGAIRAVDLSLSATVRLIVAVQSGFGTWGILSEAGRTVVGALATPTFTTALVAIEIVAALALYGLYRMLSQEKESF